MDRDEWLPLPEADPNDVWLPVPDAAPQARGRIGNPGIRAVTTMQPQLGPSPGGFDPVPPPAPLDFNLNRSRPQEPAPVDRPILLDDAGNVAPRALTPGEQAYQTMGTGARIRDQFLSGVQTLRQGGLSVPLTQAFAQLQELDQVEAATDPATLSPRLQRLAGPEMQAERERLRADAERRMGEAIGSIISSQQYQQTLAANPNARDLVEAGNQGRWRDVWALLKNDPFGITQQLGVESLPMSAASIIPGVAGAAIAGRGGAAALAGIGGYAVEGGTRVIEALNETMTRSGVDLGDAQAVQAWLRANPDVMTLAQQEAGRGALGPAIADALMMRLALGIRPGIGVVRNTGRVGANAGLEVGSEMGGEAAAQLLARGQVDKPGEVLAEGLGAFPQTVGSTVVGTIADARQRPAQPAAAPQLLLPPPDLPPSAGGTGAAAVPPAAPPSGEPSPPPGAAGPLGTPPGGAAVPTVLPNNTRPSLEEALNTPTPTLEQQEQQAAQEEAQSEADRAAGVQRIAGSLPPGWTVDDEDQIIQVYDPNGMPVMQLMRPPATEQDFAALMTGIEAQNQEGVVGGIYPQPNQAPPAPEAPPSAPAAPEAAPTPPQSEAPSQPAPEPPQPPTTPAPAQDALTRRIETAARRLNITLAPGDVAAVQGYMAEEGLSVDAALRRVAQEAEAPPSPQSQDTGEEPSQPPRQVRSSEELAAALAAGAIAATPSGTTYELASDPPFRSFPENWYVNYAGSGGSGAIAVQSRLESWTREQAIAAAVRHSLGQTSQSQAPAPQPEPEASQDQAPTSQPPAPNVTTPAPTPGNPTGSDGGNVTTPAPDVTTPAPASDLEAREAAAKAKLAAAIKASSQRLNAGIDPSVLAAGIELGLIYIEKGVVKFRAWARTLLADMIEMGLDPAQIKPVLKPIYLATIGEVADDVADQMDDSAAVRAFDFSTLDQPEAPTAVPNAAPTRIVAERDPETAGSDRQATIFTPSGIPIEVTYEVRDVSALVVSNDDNGRPNPAYPQELQPRDRTRAASMAQVASMAQGLNPALLGENPSTADGAPVVSPEGVVESGNGRTMALRRAYEEDMPTAQAYREWLEGQGYDTADMQAPVLVRVRQTKMDDAARAEYTRASNERTTLAMSPVERAAADAQALGSAIERFRGGSVTSAENRPFVVAFMNEAVAKADRAAMMDGDGAITQDGRRRIEAALLQAAYRDGTLVAEVFEAGDSDIKAIGGALLDVAGTWALMRREADAGLIAPGVDITPDLLAAVNIVRRARDSNTRISTLIGQASIFEAQASPLTLGFLATMFRDTEYTKPRGRDAVATILLDYAEQARKSQPGVNLLGDPEIGGAQILRIINERIKRRDEEARSRKGGGPDLFGGGTDAGDGNAPPGPSGGRPPSRPAGAGSSDGAGTQSNEVGGGNAASTLGNLESGGGQPAAQSVLAGSDGGPTGGNGGGGGAGGRTGGTLDTGQPGDSGSSVGSPPAGGERGDFGFSAGNPTGRLEGIPAGGDFDGRGDLLGNDGVSPGAAAGGAVAPSPSGNLSRDQALAAQRAAESIALQPGIANIRATLPVLLPGQQEDVAKTEERFAKPDGYGMLFTNGTGTGKTYTGLGVIKRFQRQGKTNILIVVPDEKVGSDWANSGGDLGLKITRLADTKDAGKGIVVTTYANLGQNAALASRSWDLVVADEAHNLMKSGDASVTNALSALRALTLHPDGALALHDMENQEAVNEVSALALELKALRRQVSVAGDRTGQLAAQIGRVEAKLDPLTSRLAESRAAVKRRVMESQGATRPRAMFLSATPFAYEKNIEWAQGYLFEYGAEPESGGYNTPSAQQRFMIEHFGYSMKYGKLTEPGPLVDRGLMQREFNTWLRREGSLSARSLDVPADYDRRFILIDSRIGNRVDEALSWVSDKSRGDDSKSAHWWNTLRAAIDEQFNYLARMYFLEAIKTEASIPIVQKHLDLGRKVIVFHDFKGGGGFNPFDIDEKRFVGSAVGDHADRARLVLGQFRTEFADLIGAAFSHMEAPVRAYRKAFGDKALIVNGDEKQRDNLARYAKFQDDASGPVVLLVQSAKNAGWSGHDTTGKHQRVILNLGLPVAPTTAIQQEGRAYRTGQASNAIMRYMNTGTNWERFAFASKISARASTAENLGMGEDARALKDAFIGAFEASDNFEPGHEGEGIGGKEADRLSNASPTPFGRAKAYYFGQQKKNPRTKSQEGNDYFATPEPLGQRMVAWADARGGNAVLEPSAGHGAIARWFGDNLARTAIEPSNALRARLAMVMNPESDRLLSSTFEDLNIVNKYDVIVMNPPFGVGGKMAIEHLAKAANHLRDGGRIVALIPIGPAADKRFDQWLYAKDDKGRSTNPDLHFVADIRLPTSTFERAGTNVATRIVIIDKQSDKAAVGRIGTTKTVDISDASNVTALFDRIENMEMPLRQLAAPAARTPAPPAYGAPITPPANGVRTPAQEPAGTVERGDEPIIEHTTQSGKVLRGIVRKGITRAQARALDLYTFPKDGGFFIREKHLKPPSPATPPETDDGTGPLYANPFDPALFMRLFGRPAGRAVRAAAAGMRDRNIAAVKANWANTRLPDGVEVDDPVRLRDLTPFLSVLRRPSRMFRKWPAVAALVDQGIAAERRMNNWQTRMDKRVELTLRTLEKQKGDRAKVTAALFDADANEVDIAKKDLADKHFAAHDLSPAEATAARELNALVRMNARLVDNHRRAMMPKVRKRKAEIWASMTAIMDRAAVKSPEYQKLYAQRGRLNIKIRNNTGDLAAHAAEIESINAQLRMMRAADPKLQERMAELQVEYDALESRLANTSVQRRPGYFPHKFFGSWRMFKMEGVDEETGEQIRTEITSDQGFYDTEEQAIEAARAYLKANPNAKLRIERKVSMMPSGAGGAVLSDAEYSRLRRGLENATGIEGQALNDALSGAARRRSRRRMFTAAMFRTGAEGFSQDLQRVLKTHNSQSVRYVEMDKLKFAYVATTERLGLSPSRARAMEMEGKAELFRALESWWNDVNGNKQQSEEAVDGLLHKMGLPGSTLAAFAGGVAVMGASNPILATAFGGYLGWRMYGAIRKGGDFPTRTLMGDLTSDMAHLKLGMLVNIASAVVNLSQTLINTYPVLGEKWTPIGVKRAALAMKSQMENRDKPGLMSQDAILLRRADVMTDISIQADAAPLLAEDAGFVKSLKRVSMAPFMAAEHFNRATAFLGALARAEAKGLSPAAAFQEAQEVLKRTQFHQGIADRPELLRVTVLKLPTQFKNFMIQQIGFAFDLAADWRKNPAPIARFLLGLFLAAGLIGILPLALADWLLDYAFGVSPIRWMKDRAIRAEITGEMSGTMADFLMRGLPTLLEMDLSGRVGMGPGFIPNSPADLMQGPFIGTAGRLKDLASNNRQEIVDYLTAISPAANPLRMLEAAANGATIDSAAFWSGQNFFDGKSLVRNPQMRGMPEFGMTDRELITQGLGFRNLRQSLVADVRDSDRADRKEGRKDANAYLQEIVQAERNGRHGDIPKIRAEARESGVTLSDKRVAEFRQNARRDRPQRDLENAPLPLRPEMRERLRGIDSRDLGPPLAR